MLNGGKVLLDLLVFGENFVAIDTHTYLRQTVSSPPTRQLRCPAGHLNCLVVDLLMDSLWMGFRWVEFE